MVINGVRYRLAGQEFLVTVLAPMINDSDPVDRPLIDLFTALNQEE